MIHMTRMLLYGFIWYIGISYCLYLSEIFFNKLSCFMFNLLKKTSFFWWVNPVGVLLTGNDEPWCDHDFGLVLGVAGNKNVKPPPQKKKNTRNSSQAIQFVTFWSPSLTLEWGHLSFERVTFSPSQKGHQQNCQVDLFQVMFDGFDTMVWKSPLNSPRFCGICFTFPSILFKANLPKFHHFPRRPVISR